MFKKSFVIAGILLLSLQAFADFDQQDQEIFKHQLQQIYQSGKFKVIAKPAKAVVQRPEQAVSTPFKVTVEQKDLFRSGGYAQQKVGTNFCRLDANNVTRCLGDQLATDQGKRPSRGQTQFFMLDNQWQKSLTDLAVTSAIAKPEQPWSDDYWPIYKGILGHRYQGEAGYGWENGVNYVLSRQGHLSAMVAQGRVDELSPAEKYDLLISSDLANTAPNSPAYMDWIKWVTPLEGGNLYSQGLRLRNKVAGHLTPGNWTQGQYYFDANGEVENWMGICHGWATAAVQLPRPVKPVVAMAADGRTPIKFYPADIKALGSYLWAKSAPRSRFIGGRCNDKDAQVDSDSGAVVAENCFDTNPADWHLVITNYLDKYKHSFVMDITFDYEVWNQPVIAYSVEFFDVTQSENATSDNSLSALKGVVKEYSQWQSEDPFAKIRKVADKTKYIVGVKMTVDYVIETGPTTAESDSPSADGISRAYYTYDLELDQDLQPVGGEWWHNQHPDFLWSHDPGSRAVSRAEKGSSYDYDALKKVALDAISDKAPLHPVLQKMAREAAMSDEVLGSVVEALFSEAAE